MRPNCRSRGVATAEAMVSGLAPGRPELTFMVGKSTCGRGETGKNRKATIPARAMAMVVRDVATGRRIKGAEKLAVIMTESPCLSHRARALRRDCRYALQSGAPANQTPNKPLA